MELEVEYDSVKIIVLGGGCSVEGGIDECDGMGAGWGCINGVGGGWGS